jgi:hypothetical protein|tara:strand:- start:19 stop:228 length:210 start_codon:yes stop_codon:yes gene_type:complete
MVGRETAGKTAGVLFGAHRLHFLVGFLSEGGWCRQDLPVIDQEIPCFFVKAEPSWGKSQIRFFLSFKKR